MASHEQKSHVSPDFNPFDLSSAIVPFMMLTQTSMESPQKL